MLKHVDVQELISVLGFFFSAFFLLDSGRRISYGTVPNMFILSLLSWGTMSDLKICFPIELAQRSLVDRKWMCDEVNGCSEIPHFPLNCLVGGKTISKAHKQFNILCENLYGSFCPQEFFWGFEPFAGWCIHSSSRIRTWWALLAKRWWGFLAAGTGTKCVCCIGFS